MSERFCNVCGLPARVVKGVSQENSKAHVATLPEVIQASFRAGVPITHMAVPVSNRTYQLEDLKDRG